MFCYFFIKVLYGTVCLSLRILRTGSNPYLDYCNFFGLEFWSKKDNSNFLQILIKERHRPLEKLVTSPDVSLNVLLSVFIEILWFEFPSNFNRSSLIRKFFKF